LPLTQGNKYGTKQGQEKQGRPSHQAITAGDHLSDNPSLTGVFLMRIVVAIIFVVILASLGSALFYLMRDKGKSSKTVYALTVRIGLSVVLFLFLLFANWMGWIQATGSLR